MFKKEKLCLLKYEAHLLTSGFSREHPGFLKQLHQLECFGLMNNLSTFSCMPGKQSMWSIIKMSHMGVRDLPLGDWHLEINRL